MLTVAPGESYAMDRIRRIYRDDFFKFAMSPGFLLYELGSQLLESYRRIFTNFADQAERVQLRLFGKVTDTIFSEVSELTGDILASRKSQFVTETTQSSLDVLSDRMGRLCDDIAGIHGMNFVVLPELHWKYAYPAFWGFVAVFVSAFVIFVKKKRWIRRVSVLGRPGNVKSPWRMTRSAPERERLKL